MASVSLNAIFINDLSNPQDFLPLVYVRSFQKTPAVRGEFRDFAGGRVRLIRRAGKPLTWSITFGTTTQNQLAWLTDHAGRLLCFRDDRGGKMYGTYLQVPRDERTWSKDGENVQVEVTALTWSEAV